MKISEAVPLLAKALSLPALAPNPEGSCAFVVQGVAVCLMPKSDAAFVCRAHLGRLPQQAAGDMIERLLSANLFAQGVGGAVVGVDTQANVFLTQHFREDRLEFARLLQWLERFVQRAATYQGWLAPTASDVAP